MKTSNTESATGNTGVNTVQFSGETWHTPQSTRQEKTDGEIGWFVSALIFVSLVALIVVPVAYFMSHAGLLEKTIALSTLVAVLATHVIKTFGR